MWVRTWASEKTRLSEGFHYLQPLKSHQTYTFPPLGRTPSPSRSCYGRQRILTNIKIQLGYPGLWRMKFLSSNQITVFLNICPDVLFPSSCPKKHELPPPPRFITLKATTFHATTPSPARQVGFPICTILRSPWVWKNLTTCPAPLSDQGRNMCEPLGLA